MVISEMLLGLVATMRGLLRTFVVLALPLVATILHHGRFQIPTQISLHQQSVLTASFTSGETASQSTMVRSSAMTTLQTHAHWR